MTGTFFWIAMFLLLFSFGIFIMVFYSTRVQAKSLNIILLHQKAIRLELNNLAGRLDALLTEREVLDDYLQTDAPVNSTAGGMGMAAGQRRQAEDLVPGIEKLLLAEPSPAAKPRAGGLPEIKI